MNKKEARHEYYLANKEKWTTQYYNKEKHKEVCKKYVENNPEKRKETSRKSYINHREEKLAYTKAYSEENKERIHEWYKSRYAKNREKILADGAARNVEMRRKFIEMYGGKCDCCGETEPMFLALDHIKGQKGKRKEAFYTAYRKALKEYDPSTYRVLCHNCNFATRYEGQVCPHQQKK